ncbi:MAG TPA: TIGR01777 family oxidoreductase [Chryseolinea sp.]
MKKVILAGGSGYIGSLLVSFYSEKATEVIVLTRGASMLKGNVRFVHWNGKDAGDWAKDLEDADLLVNLTGKNVNCRYNQKNKDEILSSRIDATAALGKALEQLINPPRVWIQSASATIYRHAEDRPMDERTGEVGSGFSVDVCKQWERTFWEQKAPATRKVLLRIGIVLGKSDSALPRLLNLARLGLGGRQGSGKQYMSWIHEADVVSAIHWIYSHEEITGTFNCTSPQPLTNADFMRTLREACMVPFGIPMPGWLLNLGAVIIGTETELIVKSRWVLPSKLITAGYVFQFPDLRSALQDLLTNK